MSYQVLARKWRPRIFSEVVGQEHVLRALINALDNNRLHHAYLFTGTRGVGKTTLGRILAKSLNCETGVSASPCGECSACLEIDQGRFVDLLEVDAASKTKVEDTRELLENVQYAPTRGRYKVYLVDEVHMLSNHSFNALLKTLEEPPPHVKFILATTDPQRLPVTILSRCLKFNLKCIQVDQIVGHLTQVTEAEQVATEPEALRLIARAANGSMRDALSLTDQAIAFGSGNVKDADVRAMLGTLNSHDVGGLLFALAEQNGDKLLQEVERLAQHGLDFSSVLAELISLLHAIALCQVVPSHEDDDLALARELAQKLSPEDVQLYYQIALHGRRDLPLAPDSRSGFEMCLLRMLAFHIDQSVPAQPKTQARPVTAAAASPIKPAVPRTQAATPSASSRAQVVPTPQVTAPISKPKPAETPVAPPVEPRVAEPGNPSAPWGEVVKQLGLVGIVQQIALNAALVDLGEHSVNLKLQPTHARMATKTQLDKLEQALSKYYGRPLNLSIEEGVPEAETPAEQIAKKHDQRIVEASEVLDADPAVQAMKETFDAAVQPGTIQYKDES